MIWQALVKNKGNVTADGRITYLISILGDGDEKASCEISGLTSEILELIKAKVVEYGQAYEVANTLPNQDEVIDID